jgi:hypothetical protein
MPYLITSVYSLLQVVDIFLDNLAYDCGFFSIGMGSKKKKNETARTSPWQHIFIEEAHSGERTEIRS